MLRSMIALMFVCSAILNAAEKQPVKVEIASFDQIQTAIAKHKGKVVVVDYWSTWCDPCVKKFPELVAFHKELGDKVVCISVSVDFAGVGDEKPEQYRADVLKFLESKGATFQNFLSSDPDLTVFDKLGVASVPTLHVFGRDGKLAKRFDNEKNEFGKDGYSIAKHVKAFVEEQLKK